MRATGPSRVSLSARRPLLGAHHPVVLQLLAHERVDDLVAAVTKAVVLEQHAPVSRQAPPRTHIAKSIVSRGAERFQMSRGEGAHVAATLTRLLDEHVPVTVAGLRAATAIDDDDLGLAILVQISILPVQARVGPQNSIALRVGTLSHLCGRGRYQRGRRAWSAGPPRAASAGDAEDADQYCQGRKTRHAPVGWTRRHALVESLAPSSADLLPTDLAHSRLGDSERNLE